MKIRIKKIDNSVNNFNVLGIPNIGKPKMMTPGNDYNFKDASYVKEIPMFQMGGKLVAETENTVVNPMLEDFIEVQTEVNETILLPNGNLVKVKADQLHKNMKRDKVTDHIPVNSYIFSNDKRMRMSKDDTVRGVKIDDISLGKEIYQYDEHEFTKGTKDIKFSDIFKGKKNLTPAQLSMNIKNKFKLAEDLDYFSEKANHENKIQRSEYFQVLQALNEAKKPLSKQEEVATYQYGGSPVHAQLGKLLYYGTPAWMVGSLLGKRKENQQIEENARIKAEYEKAYNESRQGLQGVGQAGIASNLASYMASLNAPLNRTNDNQEEISRLKSAYSGANKQLDALKYSGQNGSATSLFNNISSNPRITTASLLANQIQLNNNLSANITNQLVSNRLNEAQQVNSYTTDARNSYNNALNNRNTQLYNANIAGVSNVGRSVTDNLSNLNNFDTSKRFQMIELDQYQKELAKSARDLPKREITDVLEGVGQVGMAIATGGISIPGLGNKSQGAESQSLINANASNIVRNGISQFDQQRTQTPFQSAPIGRTPLLNVPQIQDQTLEGLAKYLQNYRIRY